MSAARANAQTAAMEALIEAHATELKLPTVNGASAMSAEATREQQTPTAYLAALLEAEIARARRTPREAPPDRCAVPAGQAPAGVPLRPTTPTIPQATIAALAEGSWIDDRDQVILSATAAPARHIWRPRWRSAPATKADGCASPRSPASRTSSKKPTRAASSPESSVATPAPSSSSLTSWATSRSPTAPPSSSSRSLSERHERGSLIVTTNLPVRRVDEGLPRPAAGQGRRRPPHARAHIIDTGTESWRFRHGLGQPHQQGRPNPRPMRARPIAATPLGLRPQRSATTGRTTIRQHQHETTTDARWGHFKRPRWGHCKWRHRARASRCGRTPRTSPAASAPSSRAIQADNRRLYRAYLLKELREIYCVPLEHAAAVRRLAGLGAPQPAPAVRPARQHDHRATRRDRSRDR